jgi:hypothetical protein
MACIVVPSKFAAAANAFRHILGAFDLMFGAVVVHVGSRNEQQLLWLYVMPLDPHNARPRAALFVVLLHSAVGSRS